MKTLRAMLVRFAGLFRRQRHEAEMNEELRAHLDGLIERNVAAGMSPADARDAALRAFGGVEQVKERARDERQSVWVEHAWQDMRYAARSLRRQPGFAAVAILTLALGIGANTAVFTLINAVLLRSLPVPDPEQLVLARKSPGDASFSYPSFRRFRARVRSLAGLAVTQNHVTPRWLVATDFGGTAPESVQSQVVSGNLFAVLGVRAALGRTLTADDDREGSAEAVVVLSHAFWQRRFGGDPAVVGKSVRFDNLPVTIVGVMPPGFGGFYVGVEPDVWWPLQLVTRLETTETSLQSLITTEGWEWLLMIGRLAPGVTRDVAQAEFRALFQQELAEVAAPRQAGWTENRRREHFARTLELDPGGRGFTIVRERFVQPVTILMVVVGVVLLIACANVAGLLLARGAARQREFAVRTSLGAGRVRLMRQLATESLVLALAGGALGLFLGYWGTKLLARYLPPPGGSFDLAPDERVLCFATAASVLTAVLFGLLPAWRSSRVDLAAAMKQQSAQGGVRSRLNALLVVVQIALSVALLAGAGLFVRTLRNLRTADLGFQREHVVRFSLTSARRFDADQWRDTSGRMLQALEALPEVRSASGAAGGLMSGDSLGTKFAIDGYTPEPDEEMRAQFMVVRPRFFETLGIPLMRGRAFTAAEASGVADGSARKVVIGETLARRFFGDTDPIGRTLRSGLNNTPPFEIIGVARDIKYRNARERPQLEYFLPYGDGGRNFRMNFYVRTRDDTAAFVGTMRAVVRQVDPQLDVVDLATLDDVVDRTFLQERAVAQLGGFLSGFALVLASLGLYGVLSYGVVQRTREIGVRMALGATTGKVLTFFVGQGVRLAFLGAAIGVGLGLATTNLVAKLLYDVQSDDPMTFGAVVLLLLLVAAVASWLPARRAAKVDPMVALRAE